MKAAGAVRQRDDRNSRAIVTRIARRPLRRPPTYCTIRYADYWRLYSLLKLLMTSFIVGPQWDIRLPFEVPVDSCGVVRRPILTCALHSRLHIVQESRAADHDG